VADLFRPAWRSLNAHEILLVIFEVVGRPGQYEDLNQPNVFSVPLAGLECRLRLTFSDTHEILEIHPGPSFDPAQWNEIVAEVESSAPRKVGRDISFSGYPVTGSWRGQQSGVQILPVAPDAPRPPVHIADHPFLLEFPIISSPRWPITNYRRQREHRQMTQLLNVLLNGGVSKLPRRTRFFWGARPNDGGDNPTIKWTQQLYFTPFGEVVSDQLSAADPNNIVSIQPPEYYAQIGHDQGVLRVPSDLDDSIVGWQQLAKEPRDRFARAAYWLSMASQQYSAAHSSSFASLCIAIEALAGGDHSKRAEKFRNFIEKYAPGQSLEIRRRKMYDLRSGILHGSHLMAMDEEGYFGWAPPAHNDDELMSELWSLTRLAIRNWLKNPS
jgi:hypothetical protein